MVYSIADKTKYYRQNNNEIKPGIRCKPTATIEGLDLAGWPLPSGSRKQPEDNLTEWMESHLGKDSPEEWGMIVQAINGHFLPNDKPLTLRWNWSIEEALFSIVERKPFVLSSALTDAGHIVGLVEFETKSEKVPKSYQEINLADIVRIFIDDPYGKKVNGKYDTSLSGFRVEYSLAEFKRIWRGIGIQIKRKAT